MADLGVLIPILSVGGTFASIIIWTYMHYSSRHRERMALIESGQDANIFHKTKKRALSNNLKIGIVAVMSGIGLVAGHFLQAIGLDEFVAYFAMVLIFGGTGLVVFYFLVQGKQNSRFADEV